MENNKTEFRKIRTRNMAVLRKIAISLSDEKPYLKPLNPFLKPFTEILMSNQFDEFTTNIMNILADHLSSGESGIDIREIDIDDLDKQKFDDLRAKVENFFEKEVLRICYNYANENQRKVLNSNYIKNYELITNKKIKLTQKTKNCVLPLFKSRTQKELNNLQKNIESSLTKLKLELEDSKRTIINHKQQSK